MREETLSAPVPEDPLLGKEGHLPMLWKQARDRYFAKGETSEYSFIEQKSA